MLKTKKVHFFGRKIRYYYLAGYPAKSVSGTTLYSIEQCTIYSTVHCTRWFLIGINAPRKCTHHISYIFRYLKSICLYLDGQ